MRNKWLIAALVVSVVVNLALAGFVAGRLTRGIAPAPGFDPMVGVTRLVRFLEEDRRREVMADLRDRRREFRASLRGVRGAQGQIVEAVRADPFDEEDLRRALAEFRGRLEASQAGSHEMFATMVVRLTPEERRFLAEALRGPRWRRGDRPAKGR